MKRAKQTPTSEKAPEIRDQHVGQSNETPYTDADIQRDLLGGVQADVDNGWATEGRALNQRPRKTHAAP